MNQDLTPEQMAEVEKATLKNIVDKVRGGGVPTKREMGLLYEAVTTPETIGIPERMNGADLAAFFGMKRKTMTEMLAENGISGDHKNGYGTRECAPVIVEHLTRRNKKASAELEADKSAKLRAERETAQLDAEARKETLAPLDFVRALWTDRMVQVTDIVKRSPLTAAHKAWVFGELDRITQIQGDEEE